MTYNLKTDARKWLVLEVFIIMKSLEESELTLEPQVVERLVCGLCWKHFDCRCLNYYLLAGY